MVGLQTLTFNSTTKTVKLITENDYITFDNVPTVKVENGYYEVVQKTETGVVPVLRVPIANTNMFIEK